MRTVGEFGGLMIGEDGRDIAGEKQEEGVVWGEVAVAVVRLADHPALEQMIAEGAGGC